jgi:phosphoglycerate dehydrogenase-like enzyme
MKLLVHDDQAGLYLDLLRERFAELEIAVSERYDTLDAMIGALAPEVVLSSKFAGLPYPREALMEAPSVAWVHVCGSGIDHLLPWDPARITVTNSAGFQAEVMAQYALGALLALAMRFPGYARDTVAKTWAPAPVASMAGKTVLVAGLGPNGRAVARLLRAAGMTVIGLRRRPEPMDGLEAVFGPESLHEALARADALVLVLPLTEATRNLIDARALAAMKPGALLVNMARGGILEEAALAEALAAGRLGGAVLDVFAREPLPADSPLWGLDNVIVTPHVASVFEGWEREAAQVFADNLARRLAGRPLMNVIDPARGY